MKGNVLSILIWVIAVVGFLLVTFRRSRPPADARESRAGGGDPERASSVGALVVTGFVLLAALFVILSRQYDADTQKWAFGAVGTVMGYWLKGSP